MATPLARASVQVGYGPTSILEGERLAAAASVEATGFARTDSVTCVNLPDDVSLPLTANQAGTRFLCSRLNPSSTDSAYIVLPLASAWIGKSFRFEMMNDGDFFIAIGVSGGDLMYGVLVANNTASSKDVGKNQIDFYNTIAGDWIEVCAMADGIISVRGFSEREGSEQGIQWDY